MPKGGSRGAPGRGGVLEGQAGIVRARKEVLSRPLTGALRELLEEGLVGMK